MGSKKIIEIETIRAGQPRAYADSEYEAIIRFWQNEGAGNRRLFYPKVGQQYGLRNDQDTINYAKELFKNHVETFKEEGDPDRNWASGRLRFTTLTTKSGEEGEWVEVHIHVTRPFMD